MKIRCNVIKDLLPLYIDDVCSNESKELIMEHFDECESCKKYYESMKTTLVTENVTGSEEFSKQQASSIKKAKKTISKKKTILLIIGLVLGALIAFLARKVIIATFAVFLLLFGSITAKVEEYNDIASYESYFGNTEDVTFSYDSSIFPDTITDDMEVINFEYYYYNPFDPQYVVYLTVKYDDDTYESEMERLSNEKIWNQYTNYYSVTGEPDGYDLKSIHANSEGFDYALVPETKDNTVTYVGIKFCNYFLDLNIHNYLPDEYLLKGFDATENNPYQKQMVTW